MNFKTNSFTKHPEEVGMTYFQHLVFAMNLAKLTITACVASMIHAIFPFLFVSTTSRITLKLYNLLKSRIPHDNLKSISNRNKLIGYSIKETISQTAS
jgi:hypothetical protein